MACARCLYPAGGLRPLRQREAFPRARKPAWSRRTWAGAASWAGPLRPFGQTEPRRGPHLPAREPKMSRRAGRADPGPTPRRRAWAAVLLSVVAGGRRGRAGGTSRSWPQERSSLARGWPPPVLRTDNERRVRDGYVRLSTCGHRRALPTHSECQICRRNMLVSVRPCPPVPPHNLHGKEGVDGSSPSEGFRNKKIPGNRGFLLSATARRALAYSPTSSARRSSMWHQSERRAGARVDCRTTPVADVTPSTDSLGEVPPSSRSGRCPLRSCQ
jgi:hypothetical protein